MLVDTTRLVPIVLRLGAAILFMKLYQIETCFPKLDMENNFSMNFEYYQVHNFKHYYILGSRGAYIFVEEPVFFHRQQWCISSEAVF